MNIAVFLPNWIGDAVMATPAVRALREHYRGARLIAVLRPNVAGVFERLRLVRRRRVPAAANPGRTARLRPAFKLRKIGVDLAVIFPNSFRTALAAWLGGCKRRLGYARYGRSAAAHRRPAARARRGRQAYAQPGPRRLQPARRPGRMPRSRSQNDAVHDAGRRGATPTPSGRMRDYYGIAR